VLTIQPTDVEYVPVVATGCWVHMEHVAEGDGIRLIIGGQTMGLAKAGKPITRLASGAGGSPTKPSTSAMHVRVYARGVPVYGGWYNTIVTPSRSESGM
jgi:hypothetical protein